jgi:hypothetical protein
VSSCKSTEEEQQSTKDKVTKYTQKNRNDPKECASLSSMYDNCVRKGSDVVGASQSSYHTRVSMSTTIWAQVSPLSMSGVLE